MRTTKKNTVFVGLFVVLICLQNAAGSQDWPTFKHDLTRTGYNDYYSNFSLNDLDLIWSFKTGDMVRSSPVAADFNGDGTLEIIVCSFDGKLYGLDHQGNLLKTFDTGSSIRSTPTIDDIDGDGCKEIAFGADNGIFYLLNCTGDLLWNFPTAGPIESSPLMYNFDQTSQKEMIFGSGDGNLYALNHEGKLKWKYRTQDMIKSSVALGDATGDGERKLVFGSGDGILYIVSYPPYKIWQFQTSGAVQSTPTISDYDIDGRVEVILTSTDWKAQAIYYHTYAGIGETGPRVLRKVGNKTTVTREEYVYSKFSSEWNYTTGSHIISSPAVADLDDDGYYEIIFGSNDNVLYVINASGWKVMRYTTNDPIESTPAIADLNGDGTLEIIVGSNDRRLYVLNYPIGGRWLYTTNGSVRSSPAVADINGDGSLEIIVGSDDGSVYVFGSRMLFRQSNATAYYLLAEAAYKQKKTENVREYLNRSLAAYDDIKDRAGISKINAFYKRLEADEYANIALDFYNRSDVENATEYIEKAAIIYSSINYQDGINKVKTLLQRSYADAVYLDADYYYSIGDFDNSTSYAQRSENISKEVQYTEGVNRAFRLVNRTQKHMEADGIYSNAIRRYYERGYNESITKDLEYARSIYVEIDFELGLNATDRLIKRMDADRYYDASVQQYAEKEYVDAKDLSESSVLLYEEINYSNGIERSRQLLNTTESHLQAENYYNDAESLYKATDFISALEDAEKARLLYFHVKDEEGILKSQLLIQRSEERINEEESRTPNMAEIAVIVVALAFAALRVRKYRAVHRKLKKDDTRPKDAISGETLGRKIVESLDKKPSETADAQEPQMEADQKAREAIKPPPSGRRLPVWVASFWTELKLGFPRLRSNPPKFGRPGMPAWIDRFKYEVLGGFPELKRNPPKISAPEIPPWTKNFYKLAKKKLAGRRKRTRLEGKPLDETIDEILSKHEKGLREL
ncbi:MAG: PQQ-binding-like beta-propeller repeat protein [Candidatus Altiarchaeota archaeon]